MTYKLTSSTNYIHIEQVGGTKKWWGGQTTVQAGVDHTVEDKFIFKNLNGPTSSLNMLRSEIVDLNDAPISLSDLEDFIDTKTSNFNTASGGSDASTGVADYVDTRYTALSPLSVPANTPIIVPNNSGFIYDTQKPLDIDTMFYSVKLDISAITGSFVIGETITGGTSTAMATVASVFPTFLLLTGISDTPFSVAETITGGTSSATSTVDAVNFDYGITGRDGDGLLFTVEFFVVPTNVSTTFVETTIDIGGTVGEIYPRIHTFPKGTGEVRPISFSIGGYTRDTWETNSGNVIVVGNGPFDLFGTRHIPTRTHKARTV